jgi:UDP-N-acetylmuramoyl-L-alanyl-D-glutamate--2,6-diaminopimelate ligase
VAGAYRAAGGRDAEVIPDRAEAIARAIAAARPNDTVIVAGKGHEKVQIAGGELRPFDDREVIAEALAARGYGR